MMKCIIATYLYIVWFCWCVGRSSVAACFNCAHFHDGNIWYIFSFTSINCLHPLKQHKIYSANYYVVRYNKNKQKGPPGKFCPGFSVPLPLDRAPLSLHWGLVEPKKINIYKLEWVEEKHKYKAKGRLKLVNEPSDKHGTVCLQYQPRLASIGNQSSPSCVFACIPQVQPQCNFLQHSAVFSYLLAAGSRQLHLK